MANIFVGKLDFNATEEQLKSLFEQFGRVNRVTIGKDKETGKPKGFAFIDMTDEQEARNAVENLNETSINGRAMAVSIAEDRGGSRPSNNNRSNDDRGPRKFDRPSNPRNNANQTDYKSEYKKIDEKPKGPVVNLDDIPAVSKAAPKKKEKGAFEKSNDSPKKKKMETYKKSGKSNRFFNEDDEDDFDEGFYKNRNNSGWDDEEE